MCPRYRISLWGEILKRGPSSRGLSCRSANFFLYMSLKFYNTYYGLHYLQELLYDTTGTKTPREQEAVSTPRE